MRLKFRIITIALSIVLALAPVRQCAQAARQESITQTQLLGLLVSAYEFFTESKVDDSAITSKLSIDVSVRKSLELDLLSADEVAWVNLASTKRTTAARVMALKNALRTDIYGGATSQATMAQAQDELGLALKIVGRTQTVSYVAELTQDMDAEAQLTRSNFSELLVRVYEAQHGVVELGEKFSPPVDCDDEYVHKAIKLGLIPKFEVSNTFEPDAPVQLRQLSQSILKLLDYDGLSILETTTYEAREIVGELLLSFVGAEPAEGEKKSKLLDVNWDWYVNQLTTGKYSANNCMPACGEMVLNYLNRENQQTTANLRALSPHDGEGWYDVEFYDVLTDLGVKLKSEYDMTVKNMLRDIDSGHLLVIMCNFDGAHTGHAMVVLGYEITPGGTWFICNDPISSTTNKYGKPGGYMRRIESQELLQAMQRHVDRYFKVMN